MSSRRKFTRAPRVLGSNGSRRAIGVGSGELSRKRPRDDGNLTGRGKEFEEDWDNIEGVSIIVRPMILAGY